MKKIVVLVSGNGTNLQALIDACKSKRINNGKISLVISSNRLAFALNRAKKENIKTVTIERKNFNSQKEYCASVLKELIAESPDLIVLAGFLQILSKDITEFFKNKIINVHPSLIPSFCGKNYYGLNVHKAAIERGVKLTGATIHFVNEAADGGPIILQKSVEIFKDDTPITLQKRVMEYAEWPLLVDAVSLFCSDKIKLKENIVTIEE